MCLVIPQKVISVEDDGRVTVETYAGDRQIVKSIISLAVGEYVATEQGMVSEKIDAESALEIINILKESEL
jgi:hydrogenase maturation factor